MLTLDTVGYAEGKEAVIVFTNDDVSADVIDRLAALGIRYIVTRSVGTDHIDVVSAVRYDMKVANVPSYSPSSIAEHAVALAFALNRKLIKADHNVREFDFRSDDLIGFNFDGKTVGIIGLGETGRATAKIFSGLGCRTIGFDQFLQQDLDDVVQVSLEKLLAGADIVSIHLPLTDDTRHILNYDMLSLAKPGMMLINTSRGALIKTTDVIRALDEGRVGYLGLDVFEFEKDLFFADHRHDPQKNELLERLLQHENVILTPHQAYLTREALQAIADQTIKRLDLWQQNKCAGGACACGENCRHKISAQNSTVA
jgi:D-lactate dehydrogenase